jgi:hypothetical protein
MQTAIYAPAESIKRQPEVLSELKSRWGLCVVIVRGEDPAAFRIVRENGLEAWWLAPGLWGELDVPAGEEAVFVPIEGADIPAHERRWPMLCPARPGLGKRLGSEYATRARNCGADGVLCTHLRYHHPADIHGLWGCVCEAWCAGAMREWGLSPAHLKEALSKLPHAVRLGMAITSSGKRSSGSPAAVHPLAAWWDDLVGGDTFARWFRWRCHTVARLLAQIESTFRGELERPFAINAFEPFMAGAVGQDYSTLVEFSDVLSPLLSYHDIHFVQSLSNLASWLSTWAHAPNGLTAQAIAHVIGVRCDLEDRKKVTLACLEKAASAARALQVRFWPTFRALSCPPAEVRAYFEAASALGAELIVFQGVDALLEHGTYPEWY